MLIMSTRLFSTGSTVGLGLKALRPAIHSPAGSRSLDVAVVGAPNAGKSTLVNALLGGLKVSSVSSKYNTTRSRVLGVLHEGAREVVLTDTPGFLRSPAGVQAAARDAAGRKYERDLVNAAVESVPTADVAVLVIDVARRWDEEQEGSYSSILKLAILAGVLPIIVANKAELIRRQKLEGVQVALARALEDSAASRGLPSAPITDVLGLKLAILGQWLEGQGVDTGMLVPEDSERPGQPWGLYGPTMRMRGVDAHGHVEAQPSAMPNMYTTALRAAGIQGGVLPLAAKHGLDHPGVATLRHALLQLTLPRPWRHDDSQGVTDASALDLFTLAVREPLFEALHGEAPYRVRLAIRRWEVERMGPTAPAGHKDTLHISVDMRVPNAPSAGMLLARQGGPVKTIAQTATATLQHMLEGAGRGLYPSLSPYVGCRVKLELHVAVKRGLAGSAGQGEGGVGQAAAME